MMPDWPHSPVHRLGEAGAYLVTASTYRHAPFLNSPPRLSFVRDTLFVLAEQLEWRLQAWAVMPNHYHFIAVAPEQPETLRSLVQRLHSWTARAVNKEDGTPGRRVWFQYWDSHLTFEKSYFARLNYVHHNPVRHGLVSDAQRYPWCSAEWFASTADASFYESVRSFPIDRLSVIEIECDGSAVLESGSKAPALQMKDVS